MAGGLAATGAAFAILPLYLTVPGFVAFAETDVWMGNGGTVNGQKSGGDIQQERFRVERLRQSVIAKGPVHEKHFERRHRRRLRSEARWASSSLFNRQRLRAGWRLFPVLSMAIGAVFILRRVRGAFRKCLVELRAVKRHDEHALASSPRGNDTCQELLGKVLGSGRSGSVGAAAERAKIAPHFSGGIRGSMLKVAVLLAILALASAPRSTFKTSGLKVENMDFEDTSAPMACDLAEVDENPPPVDVEGDRVIVGRDWKTTRGTPKQGEMSPITFPLSGKNFEVYLSRETTEVLYKEGLLDQVRHALCKPPVMSRAEVPSKDGPGYDEEATWIWGRKRKGSLLLYDSTLIPDAECPVGCKVYLPKGTLGLTEQGQKPGQDKAQAWRDLEAELRAVLYIAETGAAPSRQTFDNWFTSSTGIAAVLPTLYHWANEMAEAIKEL